MTRIKPSFLINVARSVLLWGALALAVLPFGCSESDEGPRKTTAHSRRPDVFYSYSDHLETTIRGMPIPWYEYEFVCPIDGYRQPDLPHGAPVTCAGECGTIWTRYGTSLYAKEDP